ncbi:MAG: hypothetical protein JXX28_17985 [Deltaproteobacteria bacterium]|nr:hypothetical protein [Deltaproteobacteria bacterium]
MHDDYGSSGPNILAIVSLVAGGLALLSTLCCCIPFVSMLEMFILPLLVLVGLITGGLGMAQANRTGEGKPLAIGGILLSLGAGLIGLLMTVFGMGAAALNVMMNL